MRASRRSNPQFPGLRVSERVLRRKDGRKRSTFAGNFNYRQSSRKRRRDHGIKSALLPMLNSFFKNGRREPFYPLRSSDRTRMLLSGSIEASPQACVTAKASSHYYVSQLCSKFRSTANVLSSSSEEREGLLAL